MKLKIFTIFLAVLVAGFFIYLTLLSAFTTPCVENGVITLCRDSKYIVLMDGEDSVLEFSRMAENSSFVSVFQNGVELVSISVPKNKLEYPNILIFSPDGKKAIGELVVENSDCIFKSLK